MAQKKTKTAPPRKRAARAVARRAGKKRPKAEKPAAASPGENLAENPPVLPPHTTQFVPFFDVGTDPSYYPSPHRNAALLASSRPIDAPFPPPTELPISTEPTAGTAPSEISSTPADRLPSDGKTPVVAHAGLAAEATAASSATSSLQAEMLRRIEALEKAIRTASTGPRGIGDNNPPEPIEAEPFTKQDLHSLKASMATLKAQPATPSIPPTTEAIAAVNFLTNLAERLRSALGASGYYLGRQTDAFVSEAIKSAGSEFGKRLVQSPLWLTIINQVPPLAEVAHRWLELVAKHF
jgi:hypothetical protein